MPEAWPATWAPPCAGMHGPKFVPVGPYEPLHHAPTGAWAKAIAGMTDATATNATTIPIRLMSTLRLFAFTAPTAPIRIAGSEHVRSNVGARLRSFGERRGDANLERGMSAGRRVTARATDEKSSRRCRFDRPRIKNRESAFSADIEFGDSRGGLSPKSLCNGGLDGV